MLHIRWQGPSPHPDWVTQLRAASIAIADAERPTSTVLTVVRTPTKELPRSFAEPPWIWLAAKLPNSEAEVRAVLAGAIDVVTVDDPRLVERLVARVSAVSAAAEPLPDSDGFIAKSAQAQRVLRSVLRAARTSMPVLITGETGTGKELTARLLHDWSKRHAQRFVPVFCAAIPDDLMEAELFGYVRGAFSGAVRDYDGQLAAAEGGTVFLDEVDDTPPTLQTKLLRVLEDRVVSQLGTNTARKVDFRIVAATNRDLEALIGRGEFGQDLYERLAILHVELPPLRERREDLEALTRHFIERFYQEEPPAPGHERVRSVSERALRALCEYRWPGNVRELRNTVYASLVRKSGGDELLLSDLPRHVLQRPTQAPVSERLIDQARLTRRFDAGTMNLRIELEGLERAALEEALRRSQGNPTRAARLLGEVGRGAARDPAGTVRAMMRRLGVNGDTPP